MQQWIKSLVNGTSYQMWEEKRQTHISSMRKHTCMTCQQPLAYLNYLSLTHFERLGKNYAWATKTRKKKNVGSIIFLLTRSTEYPKQYFSFCQKFHFYESFLVKVFRNLLNNFFFSFSFWGEKGGGGWGDWIF